MADYSAIVAAVCARHSIHVRRWRSKMSGCAWREDYDDGTSRYCIESPRPKTPISLSIFLHEVGHHVIGFDRYRRRCEEEFHAWEWSLAEMCRIGITPDAKVIKRFERSMRYAVDKAARRGMTKFPPALEVFRAA